MGPQATMGPQVTMGPQATMGPQVTTGPQVTMGPQAMAGQAQRTEVTGGKRGSGHPGFGGPRRRTSKHTIE